MLALLAYSQSKNGFTSAWWFVFFQLDLQQYTLALFYRLAQKLLQICFKFQRATTRTRNMMKEIAMSESLLFHNRNSFSFLNINLGTESLWFNSLWNLWYYLLSLTKILEALFTANLFNFQWLDKVVLYCCIILHLYCLVVVSKSEEIEVIMMA